MEYFGWIVEDLSDVWADVHQSPYAEEAKALLKVIDKAIFMAATLERAHAGLAAGRRASGPEALNAKVVALRPPARSRAPAVRFAAE